MISNINPITAPNEPHPNHQHPILPTTSDKARYLADVKLDDSPPTHPTMPPPQIQSSFLSVVPPEPVLAFANSDDAAYFQSYCRQGRILPDQRSSWVFLPMPSGLLRVRTTRNGDIAYDFESHRAAREFNDSIKGLGKIFGNTRDKPVWDRSVYLGRLLK